MSVPLHSLMAGGQVQSGRTFDAYLLLAILFRPIYLSEGQPNYLLAWICIGFPFGIRRMFLWLVPHRFDLAGTVGVVVLNVIVGGIIGGFALVLQLISGVVNTIKGTA